MTNPIDINPEHLEIVRDILRKNLPSGVKVWAFGSRANWTTKDSSDLDLALESDSPLDHNTTVSLEAAFEGSSLPYMVDVIDLKTVSRPFKQIVKHQMTLFPLRRASEIVHRAWTKIPFSSAVIINPRINLERGTVYPFVDMATVRADSKSVTPTEKRVFKGGGSRFQDGDTLMARITPSLEHRKIAYYKALEDIQEAYGSTEFIVIRGRPNVTTNDFAYYLTQWDRVRNYAISQMTGTSGRQRVPVDSLDHLTVPLPSLDEQRTIANILGVFDNKIDLNRKMNQTLEEMARALFKSWFVDFDPVRAKMDGRWRPGESIPGLPAHYYNMFPGKLIDSELVKIPKGWKMTSLYHYALLNPESWSKTNTPAEIKYVDLTNTKSGVIKSVNYYSWRNAPSRAQRILRPGDTIIGVVRPGNKSYALIGDTDLTGSTGFAVLRPLHPKYRELIYLASTAPNNINRLSHSADGAAYPAISPKEVANTRVPLIDESVRVLHEFSNLTAPIIDRMLLNSIENNILLTNRDTRLPKLMSGDLQAPLRADRERR